MKSFIFFTGAALIEDAPYEYILEIRRVTEAEETIWSQAKFQ